MGISFLNSTLLWFCFAGAIPIIIHILNRQRFIRTDWAAMEFLLLALKKVRKRVQIENLLVLLLRVLLVIFFVLALARPLSTKLPAKLFRRETSHLILLIDTTYSMDYVDRNISNFEKAKKIAMKLVDEFSADKVNRVSLFTFSKHPEALLPEASSRFEEAESLIKNLKVSYGTGDLEKSFENMKERLKTEPGFKKVVYFISDNQRLNWEPYMKSKNLENLLKFFSSGEFKFFMVDLGVSDINNVAVEEIKSKANIVIPEVSSDFDITFRNFSDKPAVRTATISVDKAVMDTRTVTIPAMGTETILFTYKFPTFGPHYITCSLNKDNLEIDDVYNYSVYAQRRLDVLIINGKPDIFDPVNDEVFYLKYALSPETPETSSDASLSLYNLDIIPYDRVLDIDVYKYHLVILANVGSFVSTEFLEQLYRYVKSGGSLLIFLGENVNRDFYNKNLYRENNGLLPAKLLGFLPLLKNQKVLSSEIGEMTREKIQKVWNKIVRLSDVDTLHPALRVFEPYKELLNSLKFFKYYDLELPYINSNTGRVLSPNIRILANYRDENKTPLIVEKLYYAGKVILFNTTANDMWNSIPAKPLYPIIMQEVTKYLVASRLGNLNLKIFDDIGIFINKSEYSKAFEIITPTNDRAVINPIPLDDYSEIYYVNYRGPRTLGLEHPGIYSVSYEDVNRAGEFLLFRYYGVNLDDKESDLRKISMNELRDAFPSFTFDEFEPEKKDKKTEESVIRSSSLSLFFLYLCLVIALLESLLAYLFGSKKA